MDYYCEVCYRDINQKSNYMHFTSKAHRNFHKCEHLIISLKDIDMKNVDEAFYLYIIEHSKKFYYDLSKCQFKIVFND